VCVCALCRPFETLKNQLQAGTAVNGKTGSAVTLRERIRSLGGLTGLYRGILPGSISVFARNGAAMIVMQWAHREVSRRGWRS